jgi:hypothetical protein
MTDIRSDMRIPRTKTDQLPRRPNFVHELELHTRYDVTLIFDSVAVLARSPETALATPHLHA